MADVPGNALAAQLGGPAELPLGEDLESDEFGPDEEELSLLLADFDDTALPVAERIDALRAALGL